MTVKELITELSQYEPDMMVVVNGYEGGYEELKWVKQIDLKLNVYRCSTDNPLDLEGNDEAESLNSCRGPHERLKIAKHLEDEVIKSEKTKKYSWGMNPKFYNFNGAEVTAVVLPR